MSRLASLAIVLALGMTVGAQERRIRVTYLFSDGNLPGTLKAFEALLQERP